MIGDNIKKRRKQLKMTQDELATKLGVSQNTVSMYERDQRTPDVDKLPVLCKVLEAPSDYFLGIPIYYNFNEKTDFSEDDTIDPIQSFEIDILRGIRTIYSGSTSDNPSALEINTDFILNVIRLISHIDPSYHKTIIKMLTGMASDNSIEPSPIDENKTLLKTK